MNRTGLYTLKDHNDTGYLECTGCGVCTLPCPVWYQTHDVTLTSQGRILALLGGASVEDLRQSLMACVMCGACESVCPMGIDTVGMTIYLRRMLSDKDLAPLAGRASPREPTFPIKESSQPEKHSTIFLPGNTMRGNDLIFKRTLTLLERNGDVALATDDGSDVAVAMETGLRPTPERISQFIGSLKGIEELIVAEGLLHRHMRRWLPGVRVKGLGESLLGLHSIRKALKPGDLYVIETRCFNSDYDRLVQVYDRLRREVGCAMNLDLQRIAIPTGIDGFGNRLNTHSVDPTHQVRWILEGRRIERIVVENLHDLEPYRRATPLQVVHISELVPGEADI